MHLKHAKKFTTTIEKGLTKTGLDISYYPGDDGDYKKGIPTEGNRFIDNGDGTITDKVSGLMWVKDPSQIPGGLFGTPGSPSRMMWYDAIDRCENLDYAGYSDWRMPNVRELDSIVHHGVYNPAIDSLFFPNTQGDGYWTSTVFLSWDDSVFVIYFWDGYRTVDGRDWWDYYVRPVRGGQ